MGSRGEDRKPLLSHPLLLGLRSAWHLSWTLRPRIQARGVFHKEISHCSGIGRQPIISTMTFKERLSAILRLRLWSETTGQDLIEYALMAGLVVAMAGTLSQSVAGSISTVFSKIGSALTSASSQGS